MNNIYILSHGNCYDGMGAAFAAWKKYGDQATYLFCEYGKPLPEIPEDSQVFMLDFSGPRETMIEWSKKYQLKIIDHHATAQENLKGLDFAIFDMTKSGALLSWEYFHPDVPVPLLISYISDRDLWQFKLPKSKEVSAALAAYEKDFEVYDLLCNKIDDMKREGKLLLQQTDQTVKMICSKAQEMSIAGHRVMAVNSTSHWSEVGHYLLEKYPESHFVASFYQFEGGTRWSLRSRASFDCSNIAKLYGGGGHKQASGFETKHKIESI